MLYIYTIPLGSLHVSYQRGYQSTCIFAPHQYRYVYQEQRWKASRKPKNLGCKKLKAETWKKVLMMKAESQKLFLSFWLFAYFFLIFDEKKAILVSFDVKSMFTCIPVALSINLMISLLQRKNIPNDIICEFYDW